MEEVNSFTDEEERFIKDLLVEVLPKTASERKTLILDACQDNKRLWRRVNEDLRELIEGEESSSRIDLTGQTIGNYQLIEIVNRGGFATVYRAEHKILKTFAAIKVFDNAEVHGYENDLVWNNDHQSLLRLNHDNVVKCYDVGFIEIEKIRLPYMVVEFVKGKHLDDFCKSKDPSLREFLLLFGNLCEVIEYIQNEKIAHLDLKPSNILVTTTRPARIKLIDFGSSKLLKTGKTYFAWDDFATLLTVKFASPEHFDKDEVLDHQSDIYSLGVVLYFLLTDKLPFGEGETDLSIIREAVTNPQNLPGNPSQIIFDNTKQDRFGLSSQNLSRLVEGDLDALVLNCLEKKRRNRYTSVVDLRNDIDKYLQGRPLKVRQKHLGYTIGKSISRFCGFRGGEIGWSAWRSPVRRLILATAILFLLITFGSFSYDSLIARYEHLIIVKKIFIPQKQLPIRGKMADGSSHDLLFNNIYVRCGDPGKETNCFSLIEIPKGEFEMGMKERENVGIGKEEKEHASPKHIVKVALFYMSRFEITNKQWNIVANRKPINLPLTALLDDPEKDSLPKTNVTYSEVKEFCERLSFDLSDSNEQKQKVNVRLPSEAEWEYACRSGDDGKFGVVDEPSYDFVNSIIVPESVKEEWQKVILNKLLTTPLPDSSFNVNPFGMSAMNGNVWEMTQDFWSDNYNEAPTDGSARNRQSVSEANADKYVLRGGAYNRPAYMAQCSYRTPGGLNAPGNNQVGFRIVIEAKDLATFSQNR